MSTHRISYRLHAVTEEKMWITDSGDIRDWGKTVDGWKEGKYECSCGETFNSDEKARDHLYEEHERE